MEASFNAKVVSGSSACLDPPPPPGLASQTYAQSSRCPHARCHTRAASRSKLHRMTTVLGSQATTGHSMGFSGLPFPAAVLFTEQRAGGFAPLPRASHTRFARVARALS